MKRASILVVGFVVWATGCTSLPHQCPACGETEKKVAKTLLEWNVPKKEDGKDDEKNGKENGKNGEKKGLGKKDDEKNGDRKDERADDTAKENEEPHDRIDPDRPHLPEASTTVGTGHVVLESGFTYNTSGGYFNRYSFPEALLRIGTFYDWLELRIAENVQGEYLGPKTTQFGAEDLQIGVKLAMTEQKGFLPESALILQMTVPTGSPGFSADRVLPGIHYNCGWEIIKEKLSVEAVVGADGTVDNYGHTYTLFEDGVTLVYDITKKLEWFCELDSYYSAGESAGPQHYFVGGFVYFISKNFEIDIRSGVGLNEHANGFLFGTGFAYRY